MTILNSNLIKNALILGACAFFLAGCIKDNALKEPINLELLDGEWTGEMKSIYSAGNETCSLNGPIAFIVKNGEVLSIPDARHSFQAVIRSDGYIEGTVKNYGTASGGDLSYGRIRYMDLTFCGRLYPEERSKGKFVVGPCSGDWYATRSH